MNTSARPLDAVSRSWVERAPDRLQPYLRLMRLDRPIGTWLLYWPCVFGLALGANAEGRSFGTWRDVWFLVLFGVGAIVMRGAGCTYNDIVDRDIDAKVARTAARPIPSGAIGVRRAWLFLGAQCALGFAILMQFNWFAVQLGVASLLLIAAYPFMKRVTWWPQAWLGLTFNWGVVLGFAAVVGEVDGTALLFYAGCFFWTLGYDTIYALQDMEDDALAGVKSTARLFGARSREAVLVFYAAAFALMATAGLWANLGPIFLALMLPMGAHFIWQVRSLKIDRPEVCLHLFRANRDTGALIAAALILAGYLL
ncbi:MAG: 4-hydroxybenzoate octaprenyltransferase [Alphaproteobacteria bacterium]|nr:4-hydroxybenzoate octaprenyltransferase [Alphaproteobacteria bacterium]